MSDAKQGKQQGARSGGVGRLDGLGRIKPPPSAWEWRRQSVRTPKAAGTLLLL